MFQGKHNSLDLFYVLILIKLLDYVLIYLMVYFYKNDDNYLNKW